MALTSGDQGLAEDLNLILPIGIPLPYFGTTAPTHHLICNGDTIGDASSGSTARANSDTETLFNLLWSSFADAQLPIYDSAGGASTRGASALADWNAHKRMSLPNLKGKVIVGLNSAETEFDTNGETGGEKTHQLTVAEMPAHTHDIRCGNGGSGSKINGDYGGTDLDRADRALSEGGDGSHNNLQPYITLNYIVRYKYFQ